jgi:DNA-binding NarL/FixJ family response regulator
MEWIKMPRPLRKPDDFEKDNLSRISEINMEISNNLDRNKKLSQERRDIVALLLSRGWSMYGVALETGITPNTVKRIVESAR